MDTVDHAYDAVKDYLFEYSPIDLLVDCFELWNQRVDRLVNSVLDHFGSLCIVLIQFAESVHDLLAEALITLIDLLCAHGCLVIFGSLVNDRVEDSGECLFHGCHLFGRLPIHVVVGQRSLQLIGWLVLQFKRFKLLEEGGVLSILLCNYGKGSISWLGRVLRLDTLLAHNFLLDFCLLILLSQLSLLFLLLSNQFLSLNFLSLLLSKLMSFLRIINLFLLFNLFLLSQLLLAKTLLFLLLTFPECFLFLGFLPSLELKVYSFLLLSF